jgi:hypothetical protein
MNKERLEAVEARWTERVLSVEWELRREKESDQAVRMPPEEPIALLQRKLLRRRGMKE